MLRCERLQTAVTLILVALLGLGLLLFLDRLLIRADQADARGRREVIAVQILNRLTSETEQELQLLRATAAFVAGSDRVTGGELATFLERSGIDRRIIRWLALVPRQGGAVLVYPPGRPPPDLPSPLPPVGPAGEVSAIGESLRRIETASGRRTYLVIASLDFDTIARLASGRVGEDLYDIRVTHGRTDSQRRFAFVERQDRTTLQAGIGPDHWQVQVASAGPRTLLARGRQLLWGIGLSTVALALFLVHLRRRHWAELQRRVRAATADLARQNLFLVGLSTVISRPDSDGQLSVGLARLVADFMPVASATLWLSSPDDQILVPGEPGRQSAPPPAVVVAWQGQTGIGPGVYALPVDAEGSRYGVLDVRAAAPLSPADRELLRLVAHHVGLALAGQRLSHTIDTERRLAESILGNLTETVLVCSRDGFVLYANPAATTLFDTGRDGLRGRAADTLPLTPNPCLHGDVPETDGIAWLLGRSQRTPIRYNRATLDDGSIVVTLRDVSAEESASTQKAEFIALASHELRTPLAIIRAQTQALSLADQLHLPADRRTQMQQSVIQQVDRLTKLVHDLLDASRLGGASVVPSWQEADVAGLIRQAMRPQEAKAAQKRVTLTAAIADGLPALRTDPQVVVAIIGNLLDNAINYSPEGHRVRITAHRTGDGVAIAVIDQGIGIAADDLQRLFQPFQRLRTPFFYQVRGTGLGLYLSREWAKTLGATLTVSSEPGCGSTFTLHLPLAAGGEGSQPAA